VIHLPSDKGLLQLGKQICLFDLPARKIARVRKGYGMVALQKDQIVEPAGGAILEVTDEIYDLTDKDGALHCV